MTAPNDTATSRSVAAIDLGSNSFHLIVARVRGDDVQVIDKLKQRVALATGFDDDDVLSEEAIERALACLDLFADRVRHLKPDDVYAVGTHSLRRAKNVHDFVRRASKRLGHPIEVVSGTEEARLVYQGVSWGWRGGLGRKLVIDIGGGSTEFALGDGAQLGPSTSLDMGHLTFTQRFFADGKITAKRFKRAIRAARGLLQPWVQRFTNHGWQHCVGSSGTIEDIAAAGKEFGLTEGGITLELLQQLQARLCDAGHADSIDIEAFSQARRTSVAGGIAILHAAMAALGIRRMTWSDCALREGMLIEMVDEPGHRDQREVTIGAYQERYLIDREHASRVEDTAMALLDQVAVPWKLEAQRHRRLLHWGCALHELGLAISLSRFHKHGHYILSNADMAGFTHDRQGEVARLVYVHRRRLRAKAFKHLPKTRRNADLRLAILLRLSVRLNRERTQRDLPVRLTVHGKKIFLSTPEGWLRDNPLTYDDLVAERDRLKQTTKYRLIIAYDDVG